MFLGFGQAKVTILGCSYRKLFPFALPLKLGHFKAKTRRKTFGNFQSGFDVDIKLFRLIDVLTVNRRIALPHFKEVLKYSRLCAR